MTYQFKTTYHIDDAQKKAIQSLLQTERECTISEDFFDSYEDEDCFLCYATDELDEMISFIFDRFYEDDHMLYAFTKVHYRRKHLFSDLLNILFSEFPDGFFSASYDEYHIDTEKTIEQMGFQIFETDYLMQSPNPTDLITPDTTLSFETTTDIALLANLHDQAFHISYEASFAYVQMMLSEEDMLAYTIKSHDTIIGSFFVFQNFIAGFGIIEEQKRKNYATIALSQFIIAKNSIVRVQVSESNQPAFNLYKNLGFSIIEQLKTIRIN